ncbi:hypothetical protein V4C53_20210, partial [Paraburkholderia azotifigens]|uniref:hypothetical protein n=1 Tax=Paraburkholderia azotifigens TaxID=2057004 RepID=UPI00317FA5E9
SGPKARANGPKGPKTKAQSSAHGDQTSNHFEIDICSGLFSIALNAAQTIAYDVANATVLAYTQALRFWHHPHERLSFLKYNR